MSMQVGDSAQSRESELEDPLALAEALVRHRRMILLRKEEEKGRESVAYGDALEAYQRAVAELKRQRDGQAGGGSRIGSPGNAVSPNTTNLYGEDTPTRYSNTYADEVRAKPRKAEELVKALGPVVSRLQIGQPSGAVLMDIKAVTTVHGWTLPDVVMLVGAQLTGPLLDRFNTWIQGDKMTNAKGRTGTSWQHFEDFVLATCDTEEVRSATRLRMSNMSQGTSSIFQYQRMYERLVNDARGHAVNLKKKDRDGDWTINEEVRYDSVRAWINGLNHPNLVAALGLWLSGDQGGGERKDFTTEELWAKVENFSSIYRIDLNSGGHRGDHRSQPRDNRRPGTGFSHGREAATRRVGPGPHDLCRLPKHAGLTHTNAECREQQQRPPGQDAGKAEVKTDHSGSRHHGASSSGTGRRCFDCGAAGWTPEHRDVCPKRKKAPHLQGMACDRNGLPSFTALIRAPDEEHTVELSKGTDILATKVTVGIDTGASHTVISRRCAEDTELSIHPVDAPLEGTLVGGGKVDVTHKTSFCLIHDNTEYYIDALVLDPATNADINLGYTDLIRLGYRVSKGSKIIDDLGTAPTLEGSKTAPVAEQPDLGAATFGTRAPPPDMTLPDLQPCNTKFEGMVEVQVPGTSETVMFSQDFYAAKMVGVKFNTHQKVLDRILSLVSQNLQLPIRNDKSSRCVSFYVKEGTRPEDLHWSRPLQLSLAGEKAVQNTTDKMLKEGSLIPYVPEINGARPRHPAVRISMFPATKADRGVLNFAPVTKYLRLDPYDMCEPKTFKRIINTAANPTSILMISDLERGYNQIKYDGREKDALLILVNANHRDYELKSLPQGGAPSSFIFNSIVKQRVGDCAGVDFYADDLTVTSGPGALVGVDHHGVALWDLDEYMSRLEALFARLNDKDLGLRINAKKTAFATQIAIIGGKRLDKGKITIEPTKMSALKDFADVTTGKGLRTQLGFLNWLSDTVPGVQLTLRPAHQASRIRGRLSRHLTDEQIGEINTALRTTRENLLKALPLFSPSEDGTLCLFTDGSFVGNGAALYDLPKGQTFNGTTSNLRPIGYYSRANPPEARKYSAYCLELRAAVLAFQHFHYYLWGPKEFIWVFDHKTFLHSFNAPGPSTDLPPWAARAWWVAVQYPFVPVHIPGITNVFADGASRAHVEEGSGSTAALEELALEAPGSRIVAGPTTGGLLDRGLIIQTLMTRSKGPVPDYWRRRRRDALQTATTAPVSTDATGNDRGVSDSTTNNSSIPQPTAQDANTVDMIVPTVAHTEDTGEDLTTGETTEIPHALSDLGGELPPAPSGPPAISTRPKPRTTKNAKSNSPGDNTDLDLNQAYGNGDRLFDLFSSHMATIEPLIGKSRSQDLVAGPLHLDSRGNLIDPIMGSTEPRWHFGKALVKIPDDKLEAMITAEHERAHQNHKAVELRLNFRGWGHENLRKVAERVTSECLVCARFNYGKTGYMPPQLDVYDSVRINDHWSIDTFSVPQANTGHAVGLIITDVASHYIELVALPNKSAETISRVLLRIAMRRGAPKIISSDGGGENVNRIMTLLMDQLHIEHRVSTPYNPTGNAVAESAMSRVRAALNKVCDGDFSAWPERLPQVQFALNTTPRPGTDHSPFTLFYARYPRDFLAMDPDTSSIVFDEELSPEKSYTRLKALTYIQDVLLPGRSLQQQLDAIRRVERAQEDRPVANFRKGHRVMYRDRTRRRGAEARYLGPAMVWAVGPNGAITLLDNDGTIIPTPYRPQELKIFHGQFEISSHAVRQIHDRRESDIVPGGFSYLVEWSGHPHSSDWSWVDASEFNDKEVIHRYNKQLQEQAEVRAHLHESSALEEGV